MKPPSSLLDEPKLEACLLKKAMVQCAKLTVKLLSLKILLNNRTAKPSLEGRSNNDWLRNAH